MIVRDKWKELEGTTTYIPTGKEVSPLAGREEVAYWFLASRIGDTFGGEPATAGEIYYKVTRSLGMTSSETVQLIKGARKTGYLR